MADVLRFEREFSPSVRVRHVEKIRNETLNSWPEVFQGLWVISDPEPADPVNSQGRVLLEILTILGVTAVMAFAVSLFVGMPPV